jgi:hypothetical protein
MNWINGVLIGIDQLGNAIAGGNPDATISARTGYFANIKPNKTFMYYWKVMELIINIAFYPLDGADHCLQAYENDKDENHEEGSDVTRGVLGLIIIVACVPISIVTWIYWPISLIANKDA